MKPFKFNITYHILIMSYQHKYYISETYHITMQSKCINLFWIMHPTTQLGALSKTKYMDDLLVFFFILDSTYDMRMVKKEGDFAARMSTLTRFVDQMKNFFMCYSNQSPLLSSSSYSRYFSSLLLLLKSGKFSGQKNS